MTKGNDTFLTFFPDNIYRYIDSTGEGRTAVASIDRRDDLNLKGYESYFTVNGFKDAPNCQKENCSSLNAFFVDIDGRKDEDELEAIKKKLEPTFIIETKNGYHLYWCLDEPIYKNESSKWLEEVAQWERVEQSIVQILHSDPVVKDLTRILRVPNTYYWKKTGDQYKKGLDGVFKIKGIHKNIACTYSMSQVEEAFPIQETVALPLTTERTKKQREARNKEFFLLVNQEFPVAERESFRRLISGHPDTLPPNYTGRNNALLITATLMRQANWTEDQALEHIKKIGWHGLEKERGGWDEIKSTLHSGFTNGYVYSNQHELIAFNKDETEDIRLQETYTAVLKTRKEEDKTRYSNYEEVILCDHPYLKKNEIGIIYDYRDGYYQMITDQEIADMVFNGLREDILWNYRTKKHVADKVACLISIIPYLKITNDGGNIINVRNGLLDIVSRKLIPHTPTFVSLIQYPVEFDPKANCPLWEQCVRDWMKGDEQQEKITLLQQFSGYILSSSMRYDRALFMVGDGGNGKSTFIDTLAMVIGPKATSHIDLESLYGVFGMQGLIGKRLNIIEEVHGNFYQSNKLKKLISGENVTIDIKYKPQFTFRPQAKFVFAVNQMPRVDDTSTATERRICAITFKNNYRLNPNVQLRYSSGLLAQELSGILNWMLDGATNLAEKGNFIITKEQTQMLSDYREENSSVEGFLAECITYDPEESVDSPELYAEYKKWCLSDGGRKIKANISFTKEVKAFGAKNQKFTFIPRETHRTEARFVGIRLNPLWKAQGNNWSKDFN